jgi:HTH-type transcriptional regulator / antitoxin HipB
LAMAVNVRAMGALVRNFRKERGMTQAELAQRAGVSRKWLIEFEKGKPEAQLWMVIDVLNVLGYELEIEKRP